MTRYKKEGYTKHYIIFQQEYLNNTVHWYYHKKQKGLRIVIDALRRKPKYRYANDKIVINSCLFINCGTMNIDKKLCAIRLENGFIAFSGIEKAYLI